MKTHPNFAARIFGILAIAGVGWLQPTAAYGQTAEGTPIDNIATVSFTDANSNVYSTVQHNVIVTVGHAAAIDAVAVQATATPASPSLLNTLDFYVINVSNGIDTVSVVGNISDGAVLGLTKYTYNLTDYANVGLLNAALLLVSLNATDTVAVTVTYEVFADQGGVPSTFTLTGTSIRDISATDNDNTVVTPALAGTVAVTPNGGQTLNHLPSGGASPTYTFQFTVTSSMTGAEDFDLLVTSPGSSVITIVSVNAIAGDSTRINILAGGTPTVDVIYSVAGAEAAQDTLYLQARSVANGATNDQGFADMTVVAADLSIVKLAYRDNQTTLLGGGDTVLPGEFIQYKVTVTNDGSATASSVQVTDNLPATLAYNTSSNDVGSWTFSGAGNNRTADLDTTLAAAASASFWIRVLVN
jgi:uncharacterized repeat protein (TIGR01451 family)